VLGLPRQRPIFHAVHFVRVVPSRAFHRRHQSQSCRRRLFAGMRHVPQHCGVDPGDIRPQQNPIPFNRSSYRTPVLNLPRQRPVLDSIRNVRIVPSRAFHRRRQSEPRCCGFSAGLHGLPQHRGVDTGFIRPQQNPISFNRRSYRPSVFGLSRQRAIFDPVYGLRVVPPRAFHRRDKSQSRHRRFSAGLFHLSQRFGMDPVPF